MFPPQDSPTDPVSPLRSPIRPKPPEKHRPKTEVSSAQPRKEPAVDPQNSISALELLHKKIDYIANEFAAGKLNRAQFDAIYRRYDDQRQVLERLIERNPDSQAWKQVVQPGLTAHLREQFEARCQCYAVFTLDSTTTPLIVDGPQQPDIQQIVPVVHTLLDRKNRPRTGLARTHLGGDRWLVLALGENSFTCVLYQLEPSLSQINRVRDLHNDFERANSSTLAQHTGTSDKMVFPQRALVEQA